MAKTKTITTAEALKVIREMCEQENMHYVKCNGIKGYAQAHYYNDEPESGIEGAIDLCGAPVEVHEVNEPGTDYWVSEYGKGYLYNEKTGNYEDLGEDYVLLDDDFDVSVAVPAIELYKANYPNVTVEDSPAEVETANENNTSNTMSKNTKAHSHLNTVLFIVLILFVFFGFSK